EREAPVKFSRRSGILAGALAVGLMTLGTAAAVQAAPSLPSPSGTGALQAQAARSADAFVAGRPAVLHPSADGAFVQHEAVSSAGLQYVPYDRTYRGLRVIGGDFVVVTDGAGQVRYTSVAQRQAIGALAVTPKLTAAEAEAVARAKVAGVSAVEG